GRWGWCGFSRGDPLRYRSLPYKSMIGPETQRIHSVLRAPSLYELHQAAQGDSGGAFGDPRFALFHPGGAGYVEVDPGSVFGELFQEHGGEDGASPAASGIDHIGDVGFEILFVFVV